MNKEKDLSVVNQINEYLHEFARGHNDAIVGLYEVAHQESPYLGSIHCARIQL